MVGFHGITLTDPWRHRGHRAKAPSAPHAAAVALPGRGSPESPRGDWGTPGIQNDAFGELGK